MIDIQHYSKVYDKLVAVDDLSFTVEPGQILGLAGPNGAGKTTTLRAIAGIIPPTRGELIVGGHDIVRDPVAAKSRLAYVPDDPRLFDTLTVWEHLAFVASAYRVPDFRAKAEALMERFELTEKRNALGQSLSRGMRQKLAICCAYLHTPAALLFDEPHSGLDPRGIRTMRDSIVEHARNGVAIVVSSHLLALVEGLCTHLLILHRGKSLYAGPITEARTAFEGVDTDASLEEVFLHATEVPAAVPPSGTTE